MKHAIVTKAFPGRPDHEAHVREVKEGEVIHGSLAEIAIKDKNAEEVSKEDADAYEAAQAEEENARREETKPEASRGGGRGKKARASGSNSEAGGE